MVNTSKLEGRIRECGYTMAFVATQLGISRQAFRLKRSGKRQFTGYEIKVLSDLLHIESLEFQWFEEFCRLIEY